MRDLPDELETDVVADALAEGWGFEADTIEYAAVGAGSYHWFATDGAGTRRFVTVDDLDQKSWLGDTRDVVCDALSAPSTRPSHSGPQASTSSSHPFRRAAANR